MNEQGEPQCECPTLDENDDEEVCGMAVYGVSVTRKTWENERFLRRHACVTDADDYVVSHKGPCGGTVKPVSSSHSKIDKIKVLKTNGSLMKVERIAESSLGACRMLSWNHDYFGSLAK